MSNLKQIYYCIVMYMSDNNGRFPDCEGYPAWTAGDPDDPNYPTYPTALCTALEPYLPERASSWANKVFFCMTQFRTYNLTYKIGTYRYNEYFRAKLPSQITSMDKRPMLQDNTAQEGVNPKYSSPHPLYVGRNILFGDGHVSWYRAPGSAGESWDEVD